MNEFKTIELLSGDISSQLLMMFMIGVPLMILPPFIVMTLKGNMLQALKMLAISCLGVVAIPTFIMTPVGLYLLWLPWKESVFSALPSSKTNERQS